MDYRARQQAVSIQQDWLKVNGSSWSFLHFLLLFCSWTLSVRPLHCSLLGMKSADIFPVTPILFSVPSDECRPLHLFLLLSIGSRSMALTRPHRNLTEVDIVGSTVHFPSF